MQDNNLLRLQFDYSTMVYLDIIIRIVHFSLHHTKQIQLGTLTQRNHKISIYGQYVNRCITSALFAFALPFTINSNDLNYF